MNLSGLGPLSLLLAKYTLLHKVNNVTLCVAKTSVFMFRFSRTKRGTMF